MDLVENRGGTPQSERGAAREVVLTRAEQEFLTLLLSHIDADAPHTSDESKRELTISAKRAELSQPQREFIQGYIENGGDLISMAEGGLCSPDQFVRYLTRPAVFRILSEVSKLLPNVRGPIPTKEELLVSWGVVSRSEAMPLSYQREARQELAKLLGYYPNGSGDNINVGVQLVLKGDLGDE